MGRFVTLLITLLVGFAAQSAVLNTSRYAPFRPKVKEHLDNLLSEQIQRFTYSVAVDGGSTGTAHGTGKFLPAKAIITRSYLKFDNAFIDSGTGTGAIYCEDAGNILAAEDLTAHSTGALVEGASTGAVAGFKDNIAARCEISVLFGANVGPTSGKLTGWVHYIISE